MWENTGDQRERYWHMVLTWPQVQEKSKPVQILELPAQLTLEVA